LNGQTTYTVDENKDSLSTQRSLGCNNNLYPAFAGAKGICRDSLRGLYDSTSELLSAHPQFLNTPFWSVIDGIIVVFPSKKTMHRSPSDHGSIVCLTRKKLSTAETSIFTGA